MTCVKDMIKTTAVDSISSRIYRFYE